MTGTGAAILLAGGSSRRMGSDKLLLDAGGVPLVAWVARVLRTAFELVIVVRAPARALPDLGASDRGIEIVEDPRPGEGPLEGLRNGLLALRDRAPHAYVSAADVPFLIPGFARAICARLGNADAVIPRTDAGLHPLAGCYRADLLPRIESLLDAGERSPRALLDTAKVVVVDAATVCPEDPGARSLINVNTPEEWRRARAALESDDG